jgi:hypothetical protein
MTPATVKSLRTALAAGIAALALAVPAAAQAASFYVDDDAGSNAFSCATPSDPCETIQAAIDLAADDDTVLVDGGTYSEQVSLDDGKSLLAGEFIGDDEDESVIDGGTGTAVTVCSCGAGSVEDFTIVADSLGVNLLGPAVIEDNLFDMQTRGFQGVYSNEAASDSASIVENVFLGDDTSFQLGVDLANTGPAVTGNEFDGLSIGINVQSPGADSAISGNAVTGVHSDATVLTVGGSGIQVFSGANPTIVHNVLAAPGSGTQNSGVQISQFTTDQTGATLRRNRIALMQQGVVIAEATGPVSLDSDAISGADRGLIANDIPPLAPGEGDVSVTNVSFAQNSQSDIGLGDTHLILDSSILEDPIEDFASAVSCTITHSRGPTTSGGGCETFQTSADPMYVDSLNHDLHLLPASPLIDAGNPAAPAPGSLDLGGFSRAIDADGACPVDRVRDMGAHELQAIEPSCQPPPVAANPIAPKKCKKGRKLKRGKCVKKKKRRKRR